MTQLPRLIMDDWEDSKNTLHLFMQIVGKIRLGLFPKQNHWWHVPLYVSSRGLTTRCIPYQDILFEIEFDFILHQLIISHSSGQTKSFPLQGLSVADFYARVFESLLELGIKTHIWAVPYDTPFSTTPFAEDTQHDSYDPAKISIYWHTLCFVNSVFEKFRGEFLGKSTPVHLFWHHADLALTRFNGELAPVVARRSNVDREAYSHEVISFGFWMGDSIVREPAFYAYVSPEPKNLAANRLQFSGAEWNTDFGYSMLFYLFEHVRTASDPSETLLEFLRYAYQLMATANHWDTDGFMRK